MVLFLARVIVSPFRKPIVLLFGQRQGDQCARSRLVSNREARPSPASLLRPKKRKSNPILFRGGVERFSILQKKLPRAFLRYRTAYCSDCQDRVASVAAHNRASASAIQVASDSQLPMCAK